jgi:TPR repeat protein
LKKEDEDKLVQEILTKNSTELQRTLGISKLEIGKDVSDTTGTEIIKFAASKGSPEALLIAGRAHEQGIILDKDIILASAYYLKAYRLGSNRAAQYLLELSRSEGYFKMLETEVNNENPDAMFVWAGLTALGIDFQLSGEQAIELLEDASDEDHLYSLIELGLCYYNGNLVEQDRDLALEYWEEAIELGSEEAAIRTAFAAIQYSEEGDDLKDEVKLLKSASEQGSVLAQAALGYCYEKGIGVRKQKGIAAKLYRTAAHRGNQAAYNSLLRMYDEIRPDIPEFEILEF